MPSNKLWGRCIHPPIVGRSIWVRVRILIQRGLGCGTGLCSNIGCAPADCRIQLIVASWTRGEVTLGWTWLPHLQGSSRGDAKARRRAGRISCTPSSPQLAEFARIPGSYELGDNSRPMPIQTATTIERMHACGKEQGRSALRKCTTPKHSFQVHERLETQRGHTKKPPGFRPKPGGSLSRRLCRQTNQKSLDDRGVSGTNPVIVRGRAPPGVTSRA